MSKIAVFVEGQSELIFVREFLLKKYIYNVDITCMELFKGGNLVPAEYDYIIGAELKYLLVNIGNDQKVLSVILEREKGLFNQGYDRVIGLRDMYSQAYKEISTVINEELNKKIKHDINEVIRTKSSNPEKIFMRFSIMEIEAWFLGLYKIFEKVDGELTKNYIYEKLGIDLSESDPETSFFKPADIVYNICNLKKINYKKSKSNTESFCCHLTNADYSDLNASPFCSSFTEFYNIL